MHKVVKFFLRKQLTVFSRYSCDKCESKVNLAKFKIHFEELTNNTPIQTALQTSLDIYISFRCISSLVIVTKLPPYPLHFSLAAAHVMKVLNNL